jgi:hypothetical protein
MAVAYCRKLMFKVVISEVTKSGGGPQLRIMIRYFHTRSLIGNGVSLNSA